MQGLLRDGSVPDMVDPVKMRKHFLSPASLSCTKGPIESLGAAGFPSSTAQGESVTLAGVHGTASQVTMHNEAVVDGALQENTVSENGDVKMKDVGVGPLADIVVKSKNVETNQNPPLARLATPDRPKPFPVNPLTPTQQAVVDARHARSFMVSSMKKGKEAQDRNEAALEALKSLIRDKNAHLSQIDSAYTASAASISRLRTNLDEAKIEAADKTWVKNELLKLRDGSQRDKVIDLFIGCAASYINEDATVTAAKSLAEAEKAMEELKTMKDDTEVEVNKFQEEEVDMEGDIKMAKEIWDGLKKDINSTH